MHGSAGRRLIRPGALAVLGALVLVGCRPGMPVREAVRPSAPYEQYVQSLRDARLDGTALGQEWLDAGERALEHSVLVTLPFQETGYLAPERPSAIGYRIDLRRGQRLTLEVELESAEPARIFIDAFELASAWEPPRRVAHAEAGSTSLTFEPRRDGMYVVRLQPELLRGGRFQIVQRVTASIGFPVSGHDSRAVASSFGAPRDGGGREHHGIDIFAPRGTPVLSATDGWVSGVHTTARGGLVVWVWDPSRRTSLYYAHLDEQHVTVGQRVTAGDQVGTVGNTGNARGTAPHLHFGIYRRGEGPVDPLPYVHEPRGTPRAPTAALEPLGTLRRTTPARLRLHAGAALTAPLVRELPRHTIVRIEAATGDRYRIALPDGTRGFVTARATQALASPIRQHQSTGAAVLRQHPTPTATTVDSIGAGAAVPVLGQFQDYVLVRTPGGREGWLDPHLCCGVSY